MTYVHEHPWSAKALLNLTLDGSASDRCGTVRPGSLARPRLRSGSRSGRHGAAPGRSPDRPRLSSRPALRPSRRSVAILLVLRARRAELGGSPRHRRRGGARLLRARAAVGADSDRCRAVGHRRAPRAPPRRDRSQLVALVAILLVAGPWWGYQTSRFGNPIQSNLDRAGLHARPAARVVLHLPFPSPISITQPVSGVVQERAPTEVPRRAMERLVRLPTTTGPTPSRADRLRRFVPERARLRWRRPRARRPPRLRHLRPFAAPSRDPGIGREDAVLASLTTLFILGWAAYVFTLVRLPTDRRRPDPGPLPPVPRPRCRVSSQCAQRRWAWLRSQVHPDRARAVARALRYELCDGDRHVLRVGASPRTRRRPVAGRSSTLRTDAGNLASAPGDDGRERRWLDPLGVLVGVRCLIPLATLAFSGSRVAGAPAYRYQPLNGDSFVYYAAAREFIASFLRVSRPLFLCSVSSLVAAALVIGVRCWRGQPQHRASRSSFLRQRSRSR